MNNWNLDRIYNGYSSPEFIKDKERLLSLIETHKKIDYSTKSDKDLLKRSIKIIEEETFLSSALLGYAYLRFSVNSSDLDTIKAIGSLESIAKETTAPLVSFKKFLKNYENLEETIKDDEYLQGYEYFIQKTKEESNRMLGDETEILLSDLRRSSSSAWERLFDTLTSTLEVDYEGRKITLPEVRNLAYSTDPKVRKEAYEAELASYSKIDKPIAAALSSIKQETTTMAKARGFDSPLDKTLDQTGMTRKTLDALISSIEEYLPVFRKYLRRKGEILGYNDGLPFFELFASMGKCDKTYSIDEANEYLVSRFKTFNQEISDLIDTATKNDWIDYLPRQGKVGGAFCSDAKCIKECRILTNFDGSFGSVITLAHELGHAYHAHVLKDMSILHDGYPMQLAETASTFNETFIKDDAMRNASSNDELLNILETSIQDDTQVIVDILSRYYFELSVFEKSDQAALSPSELCDLMRDAQLRSYGDGLDKNYLHPYMWCCKGHYYSSSLSFYNFPYAFGQLFAYGLYKIYQEKGEEFFPLYKKILMDSGRKPIRECVLEASIDTDSPEFWKKSLDLIKEKIDRFLELTK